MGGVRRPKVGLEVGRAKAQLLCPLFRVVCLLHGQKESQAPDANPSRGVGIRRLHNAEDGRDIVRLVGCLKVRAGLDERPELL
jgi:hypothetical protein